MLFLGCEISRSTGVFAQSSARQVLLAIPIGEGVASISGVDNSRSEHQAIYYIDDP